MQMILATENNITVLIVVVQRIFHIKWKQKILLTVVTYG